jgi:transposase
MVKKWGSRIRKHSPEFRADAVKLVHLGNKPLHRVAKDLGLTPSVLRQWVEQEEAERRARQGLNASEKDELVLLRRENEQLRMERELLKKAAAFFARHQD